MRDSIIRITQSLIESESPFTILSPCRKQNTKFTQIYASYRDIRYRCCLCNNWGILHFDKDQNINPESHAIINLLLFPPVKTTIYLCRQIWYGHMKLFPSFRPCSLSSLWHFIESTIKPSCTCSNIPGHEYNQCNLIIYPRVIVKRLGFLVKNANHGGQCLT